MGTIRTGLVSITFRRRTIEQIVALVAQAGQQAIEWGGDIHVPHGDLAAARRAANACGDAGILTPSYGSYFKLGASEAAGVPFRSVVDTAAELSVETVRIWAGTAGSAETDAAARGALAEEAYACAEYAAEAGMTVSLEYHGGTLTDTAESAQAFLAAVNHPALRSYWQPRAGASQASNLNELDGVLAYLTNLHVFHWPKQGTRLPLADGGSQWRSYLEKAAGVPGERYAMLEFVRDDDTEQYLADARTLEEIATRL